MHQRDDDRPTLHAWYSIQHQQQIYHSRDETKSMWVIKSIGPLDIATAISDDKDFNYPWDDKRYVGAFKAGEEFEVNALTGKMIKKP